MSLTLRQDPGKAYDVNTLLPRLGQRRERLLLLGAPGSGKTLTCIEMILALLEPFESGAADIAGLIPVRVPAATWTEGRELDDWLTERIEADYGIPKKAAQILVNHRQVLPFIDGLDEADPPVSTASCPQWPRAASLLTMLNQYRTGKSRYPVVVTCRTDRYRRIAKGSASQRGTCLTGAVEACIQPLDPATIRKYVERRCGGNHIARAAWDEVLGRLDVPEGRVTSSVLSTPWRLLLATTVVPALMTPRALIVSPTGDGAADSKAADQIVEELLSRFIPAAVEVAAENLASVRRLPPAGARERRPALLDHRYLRVCAVPNPSQVERWLRVLACQQRRLQKEPDAPQEARSHIVVHLLWAVIPVKEMQAIHRSWASWLGGAAAAVGSGLMLAAPGLPISMNALKASSLTVGLLAGLWTGWRCRRIPWPRLQSAEPTRPALWGAPNLPDCGPPVRSIRKGWV